MAGGVQNAQRAARHPGIGDAIGIGIQDKARLIARRVGIGIRHVDLAKAHGAGDIAGQDQRLGVVGHRPRRAGGNGDGKRLGIVRAARQGRVIHSDGDIECRVGIGIQHRACLQEKTGAHDLEKTRIRAGQAEGIGAGAIIGQLDGGHLHAGRSVGALKKFGLGIEQGQNRCFVHIGHVKRKGCRAVGRCPDIGIIHRYRHVEGGLGFKIQCRARLEEQSAAINQESIGIRPAQGQRIGSQRIIGHHDIGHLDPGQDRGAFGQGCRGGGQGYNRGLVHIRHGNRRSCRVIHPGTQRRVIHLDGHRQAALGFEIQRRARLEEQLRAVDLEQARIRPRQAERVGAGHIIGHHDIGHLDPRGGVGVFIQAGHETRQCHFRRTIHIRHRQRQGGNGIRAVADRGIIHLDSDIKVGIAVGVQHHAGLEEQLHPVDLKQGRIRAGKRQHIGAQGIISQDNITHLDPGAGIGTFQQEGRRIDQADRGGLVHIRDRNAERRGIIRRTIKFRVIHGDGDIEAGVGFEIQRRARLEEKFAADQFKKPRIRTGEQQGIGPLPVVIDHHIRHLEGRTGIGILGQGADHRGQGEARGLVHIRDRNRHRIAVIRRAAGGRVINGDPHIKGWVGFKIQRRTGPQEKLGPDDLEQSGIRAGHAECVGPQRIIGDGNIGNLERSRGIDILGQGGGGVDQAHAGRFVFIHHRQGQRRAVIRAAAQGGIIYLNGDIEGRVGFKIERRSRLEEEFSADNLKKARIRTRERQAGAAAGIVGHDNIGHLGCRRGICRLGDIRDHILQRHDGRFIHIPDRDGKGSTVIGAGPDARIIHLDSDIKAGVGFKIERRARLEEQLGAVNLEKGSVIAGQRQHVGPYPVIGHHDIGNLDARGGIGILIERRHHVFQCHFRGFLEEERGGILARVNTRRIGGHIAQGRARTVDILLIEDKAFFCRGRIGPGAGHLNLVGQHRGIRRTGAFDDGKDESAHREAILQHPCPEGQTRRFGFAVKEVFIDRLDEILHVGHDIGRRIIVEEGIGRLRLGLAREILGDFLQRQRAAVQHRNPESQTRRIRRAVKIADVQLGDKLFAGHEGRSRGVIRGVRRESAWRHLTGCTVKRHGEFTLQHILARFSPAFPTGKDKTPAFG